MRCIYYLCLTTFIFIFIYHKFCFQTLIPIIKLINYKTKKSIQTYIFLPYIICKSTTINNIYIFQDLNINKLKYKKSYTYLENNQTF